MRKLQRKNLGNQYKMSSLQFVAPSEPIEGTEINPTTITETKNLAVSFFEVRVMSLELFKSVSIMVTLKDADGNFVGIRNYTLEGADYLGWNNDDAYLINWVAAKLGFIIKA